jgi:hypothetical protein
MYSTLTRILSESLTVSYRSISIDMYSYVLTIENRIELETLFEKEVK